MPPPSRFLNNLKNPNMNNLIEFDFAIKDITTENDMILSRWT